MKGSCLMCDTMIALGNSTKDGSIIFAKNSDRQPNEPQILVHIPQKTYRENSKVKCTYIEINQVKKTNEIYMVKPSWIWGCEMGKIGRASCRERGDETVVVV